MEDAKTEEVAVQPIEMYFFFIGFLFPLAWFIGSGSWNSRTLSHSSFLWKKRCRIAATLSLTVLIVIAAIIMVVNPQLVGIKAEYYATGAQTSSASDNAIRPGVPLIGENGFGETMSGISIDDSV
ncbi:hypothetical protein A0J61_00790 [Choanephora cucurbitarum]|uniref:Uncharacterized protein n=1 Tax=Choanephora cucurbitarum TaxID=101091 RepID=A0A1C7NPX6_9FUNG|nr:hypothetical protein A0J61_00790 [Choanephora cucurbitarum]